MRYRARFSVNYTSFNSPWFRTKKEAEDWAARKRLDVLNGVDNTGTDVVFNEFSNLWLEKHAFVNKVFSAAIRDEQNLRIHINPILGSKKLRNIKTVEVDFLLSDLKKQGRLAPKTINNCLGTLKKLFNDAVRWGYISVSPAAKVQPVKIPEQEVTTLSDDEVVRLLIYTQRSKKEMFKLLSFALNTGCRLGECLALQWNSVNLENRMIIISATYDERKRVIVRRTKGKKIRQVPLNEDCLKVLKHMIIEGQKAECDRVFNRIEYKFITNNFKKLLIKADLKEAVERGATFHTTRHTFASRYMRTGGNLYELQKLLGHASIRQTECYAHFSPNHLVGLTDKIGYSIPQCQLIAANFQKKDDATLKPFAPILPQNDVVNLN